MEQKFSGVCLLSEDAEGLAMQDKCSWTASAMLSSAVPEEFIPLTSQPLLGSVTAAAGSY